MARYWVYINDEVSGPFEVDQLIRIRGFSRQTRVCLEDSSGEPKNWMSPAEIPDLAYIFKAVEERQAIEPLSNKNKPTPAKAPAPRTIRAYTPAVVLKAPSRSLTSIIGGVVLTSLILGGGYMAWSLHERQGQEVRDRANARALVEGVRLPPPSPYGSLPQYFQEKNIAPRWSIERAQDALYHVTLSFYGSPSANGAQGLTVYAFEVNTQAQVVRGLNSAASTLLSEGFPSPNTAKPKADLPVKKSSAEQFAPSLETHRQALESGDYAAIWNSFSQRRKAELSRGGISREGFMRVQGLTHRVESNTTFSVLKSKKESDKEMLVLIKQTQEGRPDLFIKEMWVYENSEWKLDDEQKRSAEAPAQTAPPPAPASPVAAPTPDTQEKAAPPPVPPAALPGMSN